MKITIIRNGLLVVLVCQWCADALALSQHEASVKRATVLMHATKELSSSASALGGKKRQPALPNAVDFVRLFGSTEVRHQKIRASRIQAPAAAPGPAPVAAPASVPSAPLAGKKKNCGCGGRSGDTVMGMIEPIILGGSTTDCGCSDVSTGAHGCGCAGSAASGGCGCGDSQVSVGSMPDCGCEDLAASTATLHDGGCGDSQSSSGRPCKKLQSDDAVTSEKTGKEKTDKVQVERLTLDWPDVKMPANPLLTTTTTEPPVPDAQTLLSKPAPAGSTVLDTASQLGFQEGREIVIDAGTSVEEKNEIARFGSLVLKDPLKFTHPAGATIAMPAQTTPAPKAAPTTTQKAQMETVSVPSVTMPKLPQAPTIPRSPWGLLPPMLAAPLAIVYKAAVPVEYAANTTRNAANATSNSSLPLSSGSSSAQSATSGYFAQNVYIIFQLLFGIFYWFIIVNKYPKLRDDYFPRPTPEAKNLQDIGCVRAVTQVGPANNCLSLCCIGPRGAHTLHSTGMLSYKYGLIFMSCFPCCTLCAFNSLTDYKEKIGGKRQSVFKALFGALFCSCCQVAQDAESLDFVTGKETTATLVVRERAFYDAP